MNDVVNAFLLIHAGLFLMVNPVGAAPLFLGATGHRTDEERHLLARRISSLILLICSLFFGAPLLEFFGITLPMVRIAGGLIVSFFAWTLLQSGSHLESRSDATSEVRNPNCLLSPHCRGPTSTK